MGRNINCEYFLLCSVAHLKKELNTLLALFVIMVIIQIVAIFLKFGMQ